MIRSVLDLATDVVIPDSYKATENVIMFAEVLTLARKMYIPQFPCVQKQIIRCRRILVYIFFVFFRFLIISISANVRHKERQPLPHEKI